MLIKLDHVNDYTKNETGVDTKDYVFSFGHKKDFLKKTTSYKKIIITTTGNDLIKSVWLHDIEMDDDQNEVSNTVAAWGYRVPAGDFSINNVLAFNYLDTDELIEYANTLLMEML